MLKLFSKKKPNREQQLQSAIGEAALPSFPAVVMSALQQVRKPDSDLGQVAEMIESDPGMSVRILKTVNSVGYGLRHRVKSVHHAISLLGASETESLLISAAVGEALPQTSSPGFEPGRFWLAAARRAAAARALAEKIDPRSCSESFTSALLCDMAIPLLSRHNGEAYGNLVTASCDGSLTDLERDAFGWNHAEVGQWMSNAWQFPELMIDAIAHHHPGASAEETSGLVAVKLVADIGDDDERAFLEPLASRLQREHGLDADATHQLIDDSFAQAESIAALFV